MIRHPVAAVRTYVLVWVALMILLTLTLGSAYIPLGSLNTVINLGIAVAKALLVMLFFMHLRSGDRILAIAETEIEDLATLWRAVWAQGSAGVTIPMTLSRGTGTFEAEIVSADRAARLKGPRLQ
jgi:caa(3)-type oxidase subunit IV